MLLHQRSETELLLKLEKVIAQYKQAFGEQEKPLTTVKEILEESLEQKKRDFLKGNLEGLLLAEIQTLLPHVYKQLKIKRQS